MFIDDKIIFFDILARNKRSPKGPKDFFHIIARWKRAENIRRSIRNKKDIFPAVKKALKSPGRSSEKIPGKESPGKISLLKEKSPAKTAEQIPGRKHPEKITP